MKKISIYLTNLKKYNEGELCGQWVKLPVDDDFEKAFEEIGITNEDGDQVSEYFITDYEAPFKIGEYEDIFQLNEFAEEYEGLQDWEKDIVDILANRHCEYSEAIPLIDDCTVYYDCYSMADVAEEYCEECGVLDSIPENLRWYFDYEAFGRELDIEGMFYFGDNGLVVQVY